MLPMLLRPAVKRIAVILFVAAGVCGCETSSTVSQAPTPPVKCQVALATPPMMDAGGGSGSLAITTQPECAWEVSTSASWISALSPASGQGTATVSFRVAANDGASTRDGMIVVNGEQARVSQRAPCRYDVGPSSQNVAASGGTGSINIATTNDCSWTAASDSSWIVVTSSASGNGNGAIAFTVASNQGDTRSGSIAIGNQRSTITQAGASAPAPACNASISPTSQNVAAPGGAGTPITVSAAGGCQWTATSGAAWITINSGATGTGNGTVAFTVAANTGAARTGTLTIAGRAFTVSQAGASGTPPPASCSYSISPSNDSVPVLGATGTVNVSTTSACAWTASSNASWITIVSGGSGTGDGRVGYLVLPNVGGPRSGTLTIAGQTFTVTQAALVCSYSISPNNQRVQSGAGTGTVTVSTSSTCTWTASSNDSWIAVTSGASGTGNGTVSYSYTANTSNRDRRGTINVAGRTFTVEQRDRGGEDDLEP
jgi:Putative binding domain, N-terminal/Viral BACON domain